MVEPPRTHMKLPCSPASGLETISMHFFLGVPLVTGGLSVTEAVICKLELVTTGP